jgi:acyl-CoA reductase-like NAD-dependent aldehyde dehydrogenase
MSGNGRVAVRKTYKVYVDGKFPRSESGRSYVVRAPDGTPLANAVRASRKDLRDAVRAARKAAQPWADKTAMNRGQVLYRVAELMEGRRDQFAAEVAISEGVRDDRARDLVARSIDRWVWYAGWADKISQVLGSANPVAAPYFNFTIPEPTGVVAVVAPEEPALAGLVLRLAPVLVGGNAAVAVASERRPLAAITLAEVLATSDVPGGVVNVLTGHKGELAPVLASHMDVNAIDLAGVDGDRAELEALAADNVKRVVRNADGQSPWHAAAYLEMKTVWHPIGV